MAAPSDMRTWGIVDEAVLARLVIVSPHLDDAVLSCGQLLSAWPGATVVTVFAGNPAAYPSPQRVWDTQSGFAPDDDVMAARRAEDHVALAVLDAAPTHLPFVEYSYNDGDRAVAPDVIVPALLDAIAAADPTAVLVPFGLANPDHDVAHRAAMLARDAAPFSTPWFAYEDCGYKHIPGMLAWRVSQLFHAGVWPTPACPRIDVSIDRKLAAVRCYPSQLRALDDDWDITTKLIAPAPEQYWQLAAPPTGWEGLSER